MVRCFGYSLPSHAVRLLYACDREPRSQCGIARSQKIRRIGPTAGTVPEHQQPARTVIEMHPRKPARRLDLPHLTHEPTHP